jgi:hypothetical protein
MNELDTLRAGLEQVAGEVAPVDLHARVLASSRRQTLRRAATSVAAMVAAAVTASALVISLDHATAPLPVPSVTPLPVAPQPTPLPSHTDAPSPGLGPFADATIVVPSWGSADTVCLTGQVKITNGQYYRGPGKPPVNVLSVITMDVDGDGTADYVAHLMCGEGPEAPASQIVAFRAEGGRLVPIGRVIGTQDGLAMMDTIEARGGGQIAVQVAAEYSDGGEQAVPNQWRVYAWQGGGFRQVSGPTSFPADPPAAELSVRAGDLTFTRATSGYVGEMTVTVANTGSLDVVHATLELMVPKQAEPAGDGWTGCTVRSHIEQLALTCAIADLTAGSTRQLHFGFVAATTTVPSYDADLGPGNNDHYVRVDQQPPYVFEHATDMVEAPFAVVAP